MASITFSIETASTGPLAKSYELSEENIQRIFAMIAGTCSAYTDTREVSTEIPDPDNEGQTKTVTTTETYQRPRKLGEALTDILNGIVGGFEAQTVAYEQAQAAAKAQEAIAPIKFEAK